MVTRVHEVLLLASVYIHANSLHVSRSEKCIWPRCTDGYRHQSCQKQGKDDTVIHTTFENYGEPSAFGGLFIHPDRDFAFCSIQKNGCTSWTTVLNKILKNNISAGYYWQAPVASQQAFGRAGMERVFRSETATRAVFVRDPMVRFVSAYLNKCLGDDRERRHCPLPQGEFRFSRVVQHFLDGGPESWQVNQHWTPQAYHCELETRLHQFNFIGYMQKGTLARDAICLLKHANLSQFNIFVENGQEVNPSMPNLSEEDVLISLFTPEAARALRAALQVDYDTFGFDPEPAWISKAVGQYYDIVPPRLPIYMRTEQAALGQMVDEQEEDDIVVMAQRLGILLS